MDAFVDMLPEAMFGHPDGMTFERHQAAERPCVAIRTGPVMQRAMRGMRHAVGALAARDNNLVVDVVMLVRVKDASTEVSCQAATSALSVCSPRSRCSKQGVRAGRQRDRLGAQAI